MGTMPRRTTTARDDYSEARATMNAPRQPNRPAPARSARNVDEATDDSLPDVFGGAQAEEREAIASEFWKPTERGAFLVGRLSRFFTTAPYKGKGERQPCIEFTPAIATNDARSEPAGYASMAMNVNGILRRYLRDGDEGRFIGVQFKGMIGTQSGEAYDWRVSILTDEGARELFARYGHDNLFPEHALPERASRDDDDDVPF